MNWFLVLLIAGIFTYGWNTQVVDAATATLNFQYREGLLNYKQQVQAGIGFVRDYLKSEIMKNPKNVKARFALAQLLWTYNPKEAQHQLETVLQSTPNVGDVHFTLGAIAFFGNNFPQAIKHFSKAIDVDPQYAFGYNALAFVEAKTGDVKQSIATLKGGLTTLGPRDSLYFNLALNYAGIQEDVSAIENLQRAISLNPNDAEYYFMMGGLQLRLKDFGAARHHFEKAFELNPKNAIALLGIASTFKKEHDFEKAIELGEQAKVLDPDNSIIDEELAEYRADYKQWKESQ